jgi:hypothetical protein
MDSTRLSARLLTFVVFAALLDAAIETVRSGARLRWWVAAVVGTYLTVCACVLWRKTGLPRQVAWLAGLTGSLVVFLGLLAGTAWLPEGSTRGIAMLGLPTAALLSVLSAAGTLIAGWVLFGVLRTVILTKRSQLSIAAVLWLTVAYAVAAFTIAVRAGTAYRDLFHGESFARSLPTWIQGAFVGALVLVPAAIVASVIQAGVRGIRRRTVGGVNVQQAVALVATVAVAVAGLRLPTVATDVATHPPETATVGGRGETAVRLPAPTRSYEESAAIVDRLMEGLAQIRAQIDRTQFDVAALQQRIGPDAKALIDFVQKEIAFEQYPGMLRGADGTLMSRAGNALDQALLASALLQQAGYETRIARGELTEAQAETMLMRMAARRPAAAPIGNITEIRGILVRLGTFVGVPAPQVGAVVDEILQPTAVESTEMYGAARAGADFILKTLAGRQVKVGGADILPAIVREAQGYFWVEYRRDPTHAWTDAQPAFVDLQTPPQVSEVFSSERIPASLLHRFRVRVINEQLSGGKVNTYEAMEPWERPAAALIGVALTYFNYPGALKSPKDLAALPTLFEKTRTFVPTFNDRPPEQGAAFDWTGGRFTVKALAGGLELAEMSRGVTSKLEGFTNVLRGLGDEAAPQPQTATLSGQWIEYTLIAPGGKEKVFRRTVLDRIGTNNRAAGRMDLDQRSKLDVGLALSRQHTFMIAPGRYPDAYVVDRILERVLRFRPVLRSLLSAVYARNDTVRPASARGQNGWLGHLGLYAAFDSGVPAGAANYRSEPSLMVHDQPLGVTHPMRLSLDVINNTRRAFRAVDGKVTAAPEDLVRSGVWETHAEQLLSPHPLASPDTVRRFDTVEAFRQATAASAPIRVLRETDGARLAELTIPADARAAIARNLAAGYVVLLPEIPLRGDAKAAWWRIHPETGETLGEAADGRGAEFVEFLIVVDVIINMAQAYDACSEALGGVSKACNCAVNVLMLAASGFGGAMLWGKAGKSLAVAFGIPFTLLLGETLNCGVCASPECNLGKPGP